MFERILLPTDFSKEAKNELSCMTSIPGIREIILFYVIRKRPVLMKTEIVEDIAIRRARVYLRQAETWITTLNPDIRVTLEEKRSADITGAIIEKAEERHADLIVIHVTMKGIMTGVLLDHVSSTVLCRTNMINVMIMPDKLDGALTGKTYEKYCPMIFSHILCPTNFSESSVRTTTLAGTLNGAEEIILLYVIEKSKGASDPAVKTAELRIKEVRDRLTLAGVQARNIVVTGKPEVEIPRIAQEEDVSLIWMRSAAQGCLHDFFSGSMVHDVIMNSSRPVIIIRSYAE